ncbi:MAG: lipid-transfer protein [Proteobacteria bacterium]|nr:lipid-transfer protein [Pseudomonadota bacterium]
MTQRALIAGVGMIPFTKPGQSESYDRMGERSVRLALEDASLDFSLLQQAYVGYVYGDSTCGQKALYRIGMTGIPIVNVNNNCASGSSALFLARQAIECGVADCVLALGFEQMRPGALVAAFEDRPPPMEKFINLSDELIPVRDVPLALRFFGAAGKSHMDKYGSTIEHQAKIRAKASRHAAKNPLAIFRDELTPERVLQSPTLWPGVMTRLMACPPTCGSAAAVLVSEDFARRHAVTDTVRVVAQAMTTDFPSTFGARDMMQVVGYDMAKEAGRRVYEAAAIGPDAVDVVELHDCFTHNEMITYEALGLCPEGGAAKFIDDGDNTYGGKVVTNPSGGLLSKGHPLGATGLAQCYELTQQLRGRAQDRQVENARIALQHNLGLGGACVVTLYEARATNGRGHTGRRRV